MDTGSSSITTIVLIVDTQTPGWEKSMIKVLNGIPGATFSIDASGATRIEGNIDPGKTLKLLAKAGKHAQMCWIDSKNPPSEKTDNQHSHHPDDPHGRYLYDNYHLQYQQQHFSPLPPLPPPPPYFPQYPPMPGQQFYAGEAPQCMIM